MIELGQMQKLLVIKEESFGVYVGETPDAGTASEKAGTGELQGGR